MTLSIIIPVFRDTSAITQLLQRLTNLPAGQQPTEIILVDDGSPNRVWKELIATKQACTQLPIRLIRLSENIGQHYATWLGLLQADGQVLVTMDADLQHPPEEIPTLVSALRDGDFDLVYGRASAGHSRTRQWTSLFYRWLTHPIGRPETISSFGFRAMQSALVIRTCANSTLFSSLDTALQNETRKITTIDVGHNRRVSGISSYGLLGRCRLAFTFFYRTNRFFYFTKTLSILIAVIGTLLAVLLASSMVTGLVMLAMGAVAFFTLALLHRREKKRFSALPGYIAEVIP